MGKGVKTGRTQKPSYYMNVFFVQKADSIIIKVHNILVWFSDFLHKDDFYNIMLTLTISNKNLEN